MLGYATIERGIRGFTEAELGFKDPWFLFGILAAIGIAVGVMAAMQVAFGLAAPLCATVALGWLLILALKPRVTPGPLDLAGNFVSVFAVLSAVSLLGFGIEDMAAEKSVTNPLVFSVTSSICAGYLLWKLLVRRDAKPRGVRS